MFVGGVSSANVYNIEKKWNIGGDIQLDLANEEKSQQKLTLDGLKLICDKLENEIYRIKNLKQF